MPKLDSPLQLSPVFKSKVWGRRGLEPLYPASWTTRRGKTVSIKRPNRSPEDEPVGEVWLTDDEAVFLNGPPAGMTLAEACQQYGRDLYGAHSQQGRFPILAKFIFTSDWLSVQVHPDDRYAREHEPGSIGKCEMWYIIDAKPGAEFLLGLQAGVGREGLEAAFSESRSPDLLNRFRPSGGEAIFVPPGAIHALGPHIVLFEAEENSDVTYRLDDFGRLGLDGNQRPLHRQKGLEVIQPHLPAYRELPHLEIREEYGTRRLVLACEFFAVEELHLAEIGSFNGAQNRVEALAVISGEGRVETAAGWYAYRVGDGWLVPPASSAYRLVPEQESRFLKFYVPDLDEDFRKPLLRAGFKSEEIGRIVFA
ncbi:MAG TPA: type I phosphomannose isomerase catalytic subunit [Terriglobia bacterium]|nr:type I phosphomannose isomerase catalytic subunit [Terriglobia bacterium]